MNNEQKLEVIRQALEMGAHIDIHFHRVNEEKEAERIINPLSNLMGKMHKKDSSDGFNWLQIDDWDSNIKIAVFFNTPYMIEDINFEGVEEHEPVGESIG